MSKNENTLELDFDLIWSAISRSTQVRDAIAKVNEAVAERARSIAQAEAFDKGDYASSIETGTIGASEARSKLKKSRGYRDRNAKVIKSKLISTKYKGDPDGGAYDGTVGIVTTYDWKASLVEWGSLTRNPSLVFTRAAEEQVVDGEITFDILYIAKEHAQDKEKFGRLLAEQKAGGPQ